MKAKLVNESINEFIDPSLKNLNAAKWNGGGFDSPRYPQNHPLGSNLQGVVPTIDIEDSKWGENIIEEGFISQLVKDGVIEKSVAQKLISFWGDIEIVIMSSPVTGSSKNEIDFEAGEFIGDDDDEGMDLDSYNLKYWTKYGMVKVFMPQEYENDPIFAYMDPDNVLAGFSEPVIGSNVGELLKSDEIAKI